MRAVSPFALVQTQLMAKLPLSGFGSELLLGLKFIVLPSNRKEKRDFVQEMAPKSREYRITATSV